MEAGALVPTEGGVRVIGLDVAVRTTGVVVLDSEIKEPPHRLYGWDWKQKDPHYLRAASSQAAKLVEVVERHQPDLAVVEDYVLGPQSMSSAEAMIATGTVLRYALWQMGVPFLTVPPSSLKKFVVGEANASKDLMIAHVYKRWGWLANSQHTADAYGLALIGLARSGHYPGELTKSQQEVLSKLADRTVFS